MTDRIGGTRPRPRVALLGHFFAHQLTRYGEIFPTVWRASTTTELAELVQASELDVLIVGPDVGFYIGDWTELVHVLCFSGEVPALPGPNNHYDLGIDEAAETEEYVLPDIPLPFARQRDLDLSKARGAKGWPMLNLDYRGGSLTSKAAAAAKAQFLGGAIVTDRHSGNPFAVSFRRLDTGLGVAWLPGPVFDQVAWTELILCEWAQHDPERLPGFADWSRSPEWLTPEEQQIFDRIEALERGKQRTISTIDQKVGLLGTQYAEAALAANRGLRRLLTAQGDDLVDEVVALLSSIGFGVARVDDHLGPGQPRREDLRLTDPTEDAGGWEAIVEVRGYGRSGGTVADIGRLSRFSELYQKEKGRFPDQRIYIVNGEIEIPPPQRQMPLASAAEDVEVFGESGGVVISTLDLFRLAKRLDGLCLPAVRGSIRTARGRWTIENLLRDLGA